MTALRRGIDLVLATLALAVLVVGLTALLAPAAGGRLLAIRSGSMAPAIEVGSLALVLPAAAAELRAGDVVTVSLGGGASLTHRIDQIVEQDDRRMFRLKGDANAAADPVLVLSDQLVGQVVLTLPWLGYLLAMMSAPIGVAALLSIGGLLVTAGSLLDDLAEADDPDEEGDQTIEWAPLEPERGPFAAKR
jgi:signal peptidase